MRKLGRRQFIARRWTSSIEKDRYHHSSIYNGAPMPYMQRITWSGVALHEGDLPGHPASHGCIRMSRDFAKKLWPVTRGLDIMMPEAINLKFVAAPLTDKQLNDRRK